MNRQGQRIYRLDGIEIDTAQVCLKRDVRSSTSGRRLFQVLIYLLEQRSRLITKDELIEHIWQGTAVTDNALEQCLAELRKVLGGTTRAISLHQDRPERLSFFGPVKNVTPVKARPRPKEGPRARPDRKRVRHVIAAVQDGLALPAITPAVGFTRPSGRAFPGRYPAGGRAATFYLKSATLIAGPAVTLPQKAGKSALAVMFFDNQSASADLDWCARDC